MATPTIHRLFGAISEKVLWN